MSATSKSTNMVNASNSNVTDIDAATIDHGSPRGRTQFYHAIVESLYTKIDFSQFEGPIPENYKRLRYTKK